MLEPIKFTQSDIDLQDAVMESVVQKIIETTPEWLDISTAALRVYLTTCNLLGGHVDQIQFIHNGKPTRLSFALNEHTENMPFTATCIDIEKQKELACAVIDAAEFAADSYSYGDLLVCSGRLFMIGHDGMAGTVDHLSFRHQQKNYTMNLVTEK